MSHTIPIGVLSRTSGVPSETIRTWERRYSLLSPERDHRDRRMYGEEDIRRLRLVAQLVESGERVADLARLTNDQLQDRLQVHQLGEQVTLPTVLRAAVVHPTLGEHLAGPVPSVGSRLEVVSCSDSVDALDVEPPIDVLYLDLSALGPEPAVVAQQVTERWRPKATVVLYHYASRPVRQTLSALPLRLVQSPLPLEQIRQHAVDALMCQGARPAPANAERPVRFERPQLERLVHRAATIQCECPNHLATLLLQLRQFELYSRDCAARSREDAQLHRDLELGAGQARTLLEDLLVRVCAYDGLEIH